MEPGALIAKLDIDAAYRMVPVHPADRLLLGMQWDGSIFVDSRLPFGLRSAPKIFSAVADALQWVFRQNGVTWVGHYLDDYITVGPPSSPVCGNNLRHMLAVCQRLGVPVAKSKCAGPASTMVFLGFEIDTIGKTVKLPTPKLQRTLSQSWKEPSHLHCSHLDSHFAPHPQLPEASLSSLTLGLE